MGGVGKWIKKNPLQAAGLLAGAAVGGPALMGLLSPAAVAPAAVALGDAELALAGAQVAGAGAAGGDALLSAAPMTKLPYDVPQFAALDAGAFNPTAPGMFDKMGAFADKMGPYAKLANMGMSVMDQGQQQMPPPMTPRPQQASALPTSSLLPYGDPQEEEKWRRMAASGRFYG